MYERRNYHELWLRTLVKWNMVFKDKSFLFLLFFFGFLSFCFFKIGEDSSTASWVYIGVLFILFVIFLIIWISRKWKIIFPNRNLLRPEDVDRQYGYGIGWRERRKPPNISLQSLFPLSPVPRVPVSPRPFSPTTSNPGEVYSQFYMRNRFTDPVLPNPLRREDSTIPSINHKIPSIRFIPPSPEKHNIHSPSSQSEIDFSPKPSSGLRDYSLLSVPSQQRNIHLHRQRRATVCTPKQSRGARDPSPFPQRSLPSSQLCNIHDSNKLPDWGKTTSYSSHNYDLYQPIFGPIQSNVGINTPIGSDEHSLPGDPYAQLNYGASTSRSSGNEEFVTVLPKKAYPSYRKKCSQQNPKHIESEATVPVRAGKAKEKRHEKAKSISEETPKKSEETPKKSENISDKTSEKSKNISDKTLEESESMSDTTPEKTENLSYENSPEKSEIKDLCSSLNISKGSPSDSSAEKSVLKHSLTHDKRKLVDELINIHEMSSTSKSRIKKSDSFSLEHVPLEIYESSSDNPLDKETSISGASFSDSAAEDHEKQKQLGQQTHSRSICRNPEGKTSVSSKVSTCSFGMTGLPSVHTSQKTSKKSKIFLSSSNKRKLETSSEDEGVRLSRPRKKRYYKGPPPKIAKLDETDDSLDSNSSN